jgi:aryl carrier protein AsbD
MNKDREQVIQELRTVLAERLELTLPERILETDRLYEELGVDSIMALQLLVHIEEVLGVEIPDDMVDPSILKTVGTLARFIEKRRGLAS